MPAPIPADELDRLKSLIDLDILDTPPEVEFDALVKAAAEVCGVPIGLISLIDSDRQWFKANVGLPGATETPRDQAFCAHAILDDDILEVQDATLDPRFRDNPLVTSAPQIRFYAGATLKLSDGANIGTLCVIDDKPSKLNEHQRSILRLLSKAAVKALESRKALLREKITIKELSKISFQLMQSEERFRALSEASPLGIFSTDEKGLCNYTNWRWQEIYGLNFEESLGEGWKAGIHPDDLEKIFLTWTQKAPSGEEFDMEFRTKLKNGDVRHVHARSKPLKNIHNQIDGFVGTVQDITEQKELSRQTESLLTAIRTQFIMSITDAKGNIIEVNDAFCNISQYAREELLGKNHRIVNSGVHEKTFFGNMWQVIARGESWRGEICNRAKDGTLYWVDSVITPMFNSNGEIDRYISVRSDVTQRKLQEELLRKSVIEQTNARLLIEATNQRVKLATESGAIGIWEWDIVNNSLVWDDLMYKLYGLDSSEKIVNYELWQRHLHPDDKENAEKAVTDAIQGLRQFDFEFRIIWTDKTIHHIRGAALILRDNNGVATKMIGVNWDVSRVRELTIELAEQHELLRVTLKSIGDAVITTDGNGNTEWMNPVAERMTGWTNEEAKGRPLSQVFHIVNEETRMRTENPVLTCLEQEKIVGLANHTVLISRTGDEFGIEDSAAPILDVKGNLLGVVLVFHDVTEQRRLSGEVSYQATHDALTGLLNRVEFESRLRRLLHKSHEDKSQHALMYIDLDQFKIVNDSCGHSVGDQLLQQVSKILYETVRTRDTLARLGGDEFGVILEHCSTDQAQRVAQEICEKMENFRFLHEQKRFRIGTSIGLVQIDNRWANTASLMQAADTSCYAAKDAGRNRVHVWFDTDQAMRLRHTEMQWTSRIESALDEDRFELYAQRISNLKDAESIHVEVLLRMKDTDGTIVSPGAFMPAAERFHMATRIDRWVLRNVIAWCNKNQRDTAKVHMISINFSGQSVGDRSFHRQAIELLTAAGNSLCSKICVEITETAAITNLPDASLFIEQLHSLGIKVALDDFGAGASSFGYLKKLGVDILKIDGQFIRDIVDDPLDDAAVRCFIDVANLIGLKTVAEFVDKPAVLARVKELGIDYAQGFLMHKPEPIDLAVRAKENKYVA